ncbi:hypothetical protein D3C81_2297430 [compost metagenome]
MDRYLADRPIPHAFAGDPERNTPEGLQRNQLQAFHGTGLLQKNHGRRVNDALKRQP